MHIRILIPLQDICLIEYSLIAIMLGRLKMDVASCIEAYIRLCKTIFSDKKTLPVHFNFNIRARFKAAPLEKAIKDIISEQGRHEDDLLKEPDGRCKVYGLIYIKVYF
jgi:hypothetical protein